MIKLKDILTEDLPVKLKDLTSTVDINDQDIDKIFADQYGLEDGSGSPSPAAGVELDTIDTHLNPDDDIETGYEAVGGEDEKGEESHVSDALPEPSLSDASDEDPLEEAIKSKFRKIANLK